MSCVWVGGVFGCKVLGRVGSRFPSLFFCRFLLIPFEFFYPTLGRASIAWMGIAYKGMILLFLRPLWGGDTSGGDG